MHYITPTAARMFSSMHPIIEKHIKSALKELYGNPCLGKALRNELIGFRSLKMKRYRVYIKFATGHCRDISEIYYRYSELGYNY